MHLRNWSLTSGLKHVCGLKWSSREHWESSLQDWHWCNCTSAALSSAVCMALGCKATSPTRTALCCTSLSAHLTATLDTTTPLFCTGRQPCSGIGFHLNLREIDREKEICEFQGAYGSKYYSENHQRNKIYGQK